LNLHIANVLPDDVLCLHATRQDHLECSRTERTAVHWKMKTSAPPSRMMSAVIKIAVVNVDAGVKVASNVATSDI
jgi:hypothetical protein